MTFSDVFSVANATARTGPAQGIYAQAVKRVIDLTIGLMLLPLVVPVIVLICAIGAPFGTSGLYAHPRVGRAGRVFKCWKIRTMISDADAALARAINDNPEWRAEWLRFRKLSDDPRVLPFGRFLRWTSLDELPQIWNVIRGEMSLIGPRPVTQAELPLYGDARPDYLALRPGITGLWQVTARRTGSFAQRIALDQRYARNISLRADLAIMVKTMPLLIRPTGR